MQAVQDRYWLCRPYRTGTGCAGRTGQILAVQGVQDRYWLCRTGTGRAGSAGQVLGCAGQVLAAQALQDRYCRRTGNQTVSLLM